MDIKKELLNIHDGGRLNGRVQFELRNKGLIGRKGDKITADGNALIAPALAARKAAAEKAKAAEDAAKVKAATKTVDSMAATKAKK